MGRIKDLVKYPVDPNISLDDSVIGSDFDNNGKTRNYTFREILSFLQENFGDLVQDNKCKVINFGYAFSPFDGIPDISEAINNLPENVSDPDYKSIEMDQIPVFIGIVSKGRFGGSSKNTYLVENYGKGTYGVNGDIVLQESDLILIETEDIGGITLPPLSNNPNAAVLDLGEIPDGDFISAINSYFPSFTVEAGTNWFFDFTVDGIRYLYGFNGANGTYGSMGGTVTSNDVFLVYDEKYNKKALYNYELSFSWGDENVGESGLTGTDTVGVSTDIKYYNLIIDIPEYQDIQMKDPVLLIDRFRKAKRKGRDASKNVEYRKAGYKHERQIEALINGRQNEIPITSGQMVINLYDLGYIKGYYIDPLLLDVGANISGDTAGYGTRTKKGDDTIKHVTRRVNLAFRIKLNENGKLKETAILGKIKLVTVYDEFNNRFKVTYNLQ